MKCRVKVPQTLLIIAPFMTASTVLQAAPGTAVCPSVLPPLSACTEIIGLSKDGGASSQHFSLAEFNDQNMWSTADADDDLIGPNDCVLLLESINGELEIQGSGAAGAPIRITGNGNAVLSNFQSLEDDDFDSVDVLDPNTNDLITIYTTDITGLIPSDWRTRAFFEDDVMLQKLSDCSGVPAPLLEAGQWCTTVPDFILKYRPSDDEMNEKTLEFSSSFELGPEEVLMPGEADTAIVATDKSYITIENLWVRKSYRGIWFQGGSDNTVRCVSGSLFRDDVITAGITLGNIVVEDNILRDAGNGVYFRTNGGEGNVVARNEISQMNFDLYWQTDGHAVGVQGVKTTSGAVALLIEQNDMFSSALPIGIFADFGNGEIADGITIRYNKIHDSLNPEFTQPFHGAGIGLFQPVSGALKNIKIHYNEFYRLESGIRMKRSYVNNPLEIFNNTFSDIRGSVPEKASLYSDVGTDNKIEFILVKNNIFNNAAGNRFIVLNEADNLTFTNNLYNREDSGLFHFPNAVTGNFAEWAAFAGEINSVHGVPARFVNVAPTVNDFNLKVTSPARDAGVDVMLSPDIDGVAVPSPAGTGGVDMGAHEFTN